MMSSVTSSVGWDLFVCLQSPVFSGGFVSCSGSLHSAGETDHHRGQKPVQPVHTVSDKPVQPVHTVSDKPVSTGGFSCFKYQCAHFKHSSDHLDVFRWSDSNQSVSLKFVFKSSTSDYSCYHLICWCFSGLINKSFGPKMSENAEQMSLTVIFVRKTRQDQFFWRQFWNSLTLAKLEKVLSPNIKAAEILLNAK